LYSTKHFTTLRPFACFALCAALLPACQQAEPEVTPTNAVHEEDWMRVREPIVELVAGDAGVTYVHFERSSLRYRIDTAESEDAEELTAYAAQALAEGREVCALVDRSTVPKSKDRDAALSGGPPLIVGFE
jgi:hypothetical protein